MLGQEHECSSQLLTEIEKFVCAVYGQPEYTDINKFRYDTFCEKNQGHGNVLELQNSIDINLLPPCRDSLDMHLCLVNYQSYIWLHADARQPDLPDLEVSVRKVGTEGIEYELKSGDFVPQKLIDILCDSGDEQGNESDEDGEKMISAMIKCICVEDMASYVFEGLIVKIATVTYLNLCYFQTPQLPECKHVLKCC